MKKLFIIILFLNLSVLYGQKNSEERVKLEFKNGYETEMIVYNKDPYSIYKNHVAFRIVNLKVGTDAYGQSTNATGGGPVALDVHYRRYLKDLDYMLGVSGTYFPLDISNLSNEGREHQKINLSGELYGHFAFLKKEQLKPTRLNFGLRRDKMEYVKYYVKYPMPRLRTYNVRGGVHYFQNGMNRGNITQYRIQSGSYVGLFLGLSTNRFLNIKLESEDFFGKITESQINEIFVDVLYAPLTRIYGVSNDEFSPFIGVNGLIDDERIYQDNLGFRLGLSSSGAHDYSFEIGVLPIYNSWYYVQFRLGFLKKY